MAEPFLAEIRMVGFNFAPRGWAFCDNQILPINQNQSLYSLLGTTYGGDGRTSFALPGLRGRTPIHTGSSGSGLSYKLGQKYGEESHTLNAAEMPNHNHSFNYNTAAANQEEPNGRVLGKPAPALHYAAYNAAQTQNMSANAIYATGGNQAHDNMQPFLTINFCIALQGLFPPRN